jgi:hypothetical protein
MSTAKLQESLDALQNISGGAQQEPRPLEIELKDMDKLYLENMLLKEQITNMQLQATRQQFYTALAKKYSIDTDVYSFQVDPGSKKILVNPK